jgi:hypothetical protein
MCFEVKSYNPTVSLGLTQQQLLTWSRIAIIIQGLATATPEDLIPLQGL